MNTRLPAPDRAGQSSKGKYRRRMAVKDERGFASMDPGKQRAIASKGGRAAHERGTAHEFTTEEAREAGRKGGQTVSQDREHMAAIGRKGGRAMGTDGADGSGGEERREAPPSRT